MNEKEKKIYNEQRITRYILKEKKKGNTHLSVLDILVATGVSVSQIEEIMKRFEEEGRISEYIEPKDGEIIL